MDLSAYENRTGDKLIQISDIIKLFVQNNHWKEKPKLFFFQACQGNDMDYGMDRRQTYVAGNFQ